MSFWFNHDPHGVGRALFVICALCAIGFGLIGAGIGSCSSKYNLSVKIVSKDISTSTTSK